MDDDARDLSLGELLNRVHLPHDLFDILVVGYLAEYRELMGGGRGYLGELAHFSPEARTGLRVVWCQDGVTVERRRVSPLRPAVAQAACTASAPGPERATAAPAAPATAT